MFVLIGLAVVLIGLAHWYLNEVYSFWKKKGVPNPTPKPIVGNVGSLFTMNVNIVTIYGNIYNNYKDYSYVGFYKTLSPAVLIRDLELIKEILITEFPSFHDNNLEIDEKSDPLFSNNPFCLKGNRWKVVRKYVTSAITSGKIKQMFKFMNNVSKDLVNYLNNESKTLSQDGIDATELSRKYATDVVATCAFGLDGKSFVDSDAEFRRMGKKIIQPNMIGNIKNFIIFMFPTVAKIIKLSVISKEVTNWFIGTLQRTIKYREENNIVRNDYLDYMISLKSKPGEYAFTDMDVMAQSMSSFTDGTEPSASALSFTLYEIAKNPDIQVKLRKEVDKVLAKYKGEIVYEAIQEMQYLDMVISEALRKYPPAMYMMKVCTKQFTLPPPKGQGTGPDVVINPGMSIIIPVYAIHSDPKYYPDPEKFDPERFTDDAKKDRPKCAYMPFGEGPRKCYGYRLAIAQIKAALAATVSNFELTVNPKTSPKMEIEPICFNIAKKGGIWLNVYKR